MKYKLFAVAATAAMIVGSGSAFAAAATNPKVTGVDVIDGSLTGADIQDNSLTGSDIDESTLAGSQITGVNAANLNGQASSAFATAAALSTLAARVSSLESTVAKINGTAALTMQDMAGTYTGIGYQSQLWTTPVPVYGTPNTGIPLYYNNQAHLALHTESAALTINADGTFTVTHAADCEQGTEWNSGQATTSIVGDCDDVTTGTIEIVGNGNTVKVWITGATDPIVVPTVAAGRAWVLSIADTADGTTTILVFTKQN